MRDVAHRAGVSIKTVSRVVNDEADIAETTRQRVIAAVEELGYQPNAIARSLVSRRTNSLGVLTADFGDYTHARIIEGAEAEAREQGYLMFIGTAEHSSDGEPLRSPLLGQHRFEGLFVVYHGTDHDTHEIFDYISPNLPIVTIGYAANRKNTTAISITNCEGAREATEHLLNLGRRRIAHITGPANMYECHERRRGYLEALQAAGIVPDEAWIAAGDWSDASGYQAAQALLKRQLGFTALFVQNDRMALGAMCALNEHGLHIPDDVAVVGFDDIPSAAYFIPPLTTIYQPTYELGRMGIRLLIDRINGRPVPANLIRLPTRLVIRSSCGASILAAPLA
ncbi:MAG: LacI family DNA-binding transcriptional regulator, partial [Anaerolineae bacterium]